MIHYLFIRRDLPFGVTLAQLAHAAADSMKENIQKGGSEYGKDTVVVLGVRNLARLRKATYRLKAKEIEHTVVREPDQPWNGQMMAIGVWPHEDTPEFRELFEEYETYKEFEGVRDEQEEETNPEEQSEP